MNSTRAAPPQYMGPNMRIGEARSATARSSLPSTRNTPGRARVQTGWLATVAVHWMVRVPWKIRLDWPGSGAAVESRPASCPSQERTVFPILTSYRWRFGLGDRAPGALEHPHRDELRLGLLPESPVVGPELGDEPLVGARRTVGAPGGDGPVTDHLLPLHVPFGGQEVVPDRDLGGLDEAHLGRHPRGVDRVPLDLAAQDRGRWGEARGRDDLVPRVELPAGKGRLHQEIDAGGELDPREGPEVAGARRGLGVGGRRQGAQEAQGGQEASEGHEVPRAEAIAAWRRS